METDSASPTTSHHQNVRGQNQPQTTPEQHDDSASNQTPTELHADRRAHAARFVASAETRSSRAPTPSPESPLRNKSAPLRSRQSSLDRTQKRPLTSAPVPLHSPGPNP